MRRAIAVTSLLPSRVQPYAVLASAVIIHLTLGTFYCIGNIIPYMASYLRFIQAQQVSMGEMSWFGALTAATQGLFMPVGGMVEKRLGSRAAVAIGCCIVLTGVASTCAAVQSGIAAAYVTYGVVFGIGIGIAYAPCIACCMRWLPGRRGLVSGCVVGGFGMGAFVFNYVITYYVNPRNVQATHVIDGLKYFDLTNIDVLHRTPNVFLVMAACYGAIHLVGLAFLCDPPSDYDSLEDDGTEKPPPEQERSMNTVQMLRTQTFYNIWVTFTCTSFIVTFINSYYKVFGGTFIADDHFLSLTGSIGSIANAGGRVFWGHFGDKFSYQVALTLISSALAFLFFTMELTTYGHKPMFFIWTVAIFFFFSGIYSLFPMVTAKVYGRGHFSTNYGVVFTSSTVSNIVCAGIATLLLHVLHFYGMFLLMAVVACIALALSTTVHLTDHGKPKLTVTKH